MSWAIAVYYGVSCNKGHQLKYRAFCLFVCFPPLFSSSSFYILLNFPEVLEQKRKQLKVSPQKKTCWNVETQKPLCYHVLSDKIGVKSLILFLRQKDATIHYFFHLKPFERKMLKF